MSNSNAYRTYLRLIDVLINRYPLVFNKAMPLPLAINIHQDLIECPDICRHMSSEELRRVLCIWVSRREYKLSMVVTKKRYNLQAEEVSRISYLHFQAALQQVQNMLARA